MNSRNSGKLRAAIILGLILAGVFLFSEKTRLLSFFSGGRSAQTQMGMPVPVQFGVRKTVPLYKDYIGTTEAIRNVALQAMVTGYLKDQFVPDGSDVRKGMLIYRIDQRNYRAALDQAQAQVDRDNASFEYARANQRRNSLMVVHGDVSKDAFQQATSVMHQAASTILADKAALALAKINMGYTEIRAPFSGRLSRSLVYTGTLINTGTQINTLVQLDPIYATFNPPESDLADILKNRMNGVMPASVRLSGDHTKAYNGRLSFIDNVIDRQTGTFTARVTIPNFEKTLIPGEWVHVRLHIGDRQNALMIPQIAVGSNQVGKFVYVVSKDNKVEIRFVILGVVEGDLIEAIKGVSDGDRIIVGNQQKIGPGMPVVPMEKGKKTHV
jgi:RND family efflux transporter MFP subunit